MAHGRHYQAVAWLRLAVLRLRFLQRILQAEKP
jgi:hypothetical protein